MLERVKTEALSLPEPDGAYTSNADVRSRSPWRHQATESRTAQRTPEASTPPVHEDGRAIGNFL